MTKRLIGFGVSTLAVVGLVGALTTSSAPATTLAAPTTGDYLYCASHKNAGGTVTKPVRKLLANNSAPAHTVCGVYLVTGL